MGTRLPPACCVITLPGRVELSVDSSYNAEVPDSQCTHTHVDNLEIHNFLYTAEREVC